MTELTSASGSLPPALSQRPYAPSWFDRFTVWVERLPIPAPIFYLGLAALLLIIQLLLQWNGSAANLYAFPLVYVLTLVYVLALPHYLDRVAAQALKRFQPQLAISDAEYEDLLYRLTTLPMRPTLIAAFLGALFGLSTIQWIPFANQLQDFHFTNTALSIHFNHALAPLIWGGLGAVLYHTLHQLRVVQQIYRRVTTINLYKLRPLYAFSTLSAQTAIGIGFIYYLWYLLVPMLFDIGISGFALFTVISLLTFARPLWGAHQLLVDEKDAKLSENGDRQRSTIAELHRRIDKGELSDIDSLHKTMVSLELEHLTIDRISTWPWRQDTLRVITAALFFPVIVWLMQRLLERMLNPPV